MMISMYEIRLNLVTIVNMAINRARNNNKSINSNKTRDIWKCRTTKQWGTLYLQTVQYLGHLWTRTKKTNWIWFSIKKWSGNANRMGTNMEKSIVELHFRISQYNIELVSSEEQQLGTSSILMIKNSWVGSVN